MRRASVGELGSCLLAGPAHDQGALEYGHDHVGQVGSAPRRDAPDFELAYRREVPTAEVHILDAGHFALDEQPDAVADLTRGFLGRLTGRAGPGRQRS